MWRLLPYHQMENGEGLQHLDVLRERLAPVLVRRRRQEVLSQLPGRTDTCIDVPLTAVQQEEHDERILPIAQLMQRAERRPLTRPEFLRLMMLFTEQRILTNGMAQFEFEEVWPGIEKARPTRALLESLAMPKLAELQALLAPARRRTGAQGRRLQRLAARAAAGRVGGCCADAQARCA